MPTIEQLRVKITKLQVQADALIAKKMQAAVDQIRNIMLEHGLTTEDIEKKAKALRNAKAAKGSAAKTPLKTSRKTAGSLPGKGAAKYLHPKTGATWTGHGRAPAWIAQVKDRSKFLIAEGAAAADAKVTQPGAARKNAKAKSSATSGATAKKAAKKAALKPARKAAAKKGVAKKAVALKKTAPAKKAARKRAVEAVAESQTTS